MKDTNIIIRCNEFYKLSLKKDADELGMTLSQFIRFSQICRFYLEKSDPELYQHILDMKKYEDS